MTYDAILDVLGDSTRRQVFEQLCRAPSSVGALGAGLPVSRPAVSQHLKVLKDAGLIADHPIGARRIYHAEPEGLAALREWLDRRCDDILEAHQAEIRRQMDERKST